MELLGTIIHYAFAFIVVISVIVFIHEYGHYIVAKKCGVKIEAFSIGFGKEIFGWNDQSGTRWKVCYLPFGGYVKMFGDADASSKPDQKKLKKLSEQEQQQAFHSKSLPVKAAVVSAGPIANFLLAIVIITGLYMSTGKPTTLPIISDIQPGSAAEEANLQIDDLIVELDGTAIQTFNDLQRHIGIGTGEPVTALIKRGDNEFTVIITPKMVVQKDIFGNEVNVPLIGVRSSQVSREQLTLFPAINAAVVETYSIGAATLTAISQMITGKRDVREITGPIGIVKYSGKSFDRGFNTTLWFIVILSVNLGLINLFPIPTLDGGHLLYYTLEAINGEPLAERFQEYGFYFGLGLIALLIVFSVVNDIIKLNLF